MNSYELSRKWFDYCFLNPDKIKPNHTAVYFMAIEHCNRLGWKEKFGFPTTMVMEAVGIKSYNTYINALNDLVDWGFIEMLERSKNQYSANIIALSKFDKALNKALDKAFIKHTTKQSESTLQSIDSINKQETKNKEQINIEFDKFWDLYNKKTGRKDCEKKWKGLKDSEREDIIKTLPNYIKSTPDVQFRKNPISYLNQKTWEDEGTIQEESDISKHLKGEAIVPTYKNDWR